MFAHRLLVAEIMMFLHQTVEQRLFPGAPHLLKLQRLELAQRSFHGRGIDQHRLRAAPVLPAGYAAHNSPRGNSIWPARSSISSRPRHTMSRNAPLAWLPLPGFTQLRR